MFRDGSCTLFHDRRFFEVFAHFLELFLSPIFSRVIQGTFQSPNKWVVFFATGKTRSRLRKKKEEQITIPITIITSIIIVVIRPSHPAFSSVSLLHPLAFFVSVRYGVRWKVRFEVSPWYSGPLHPRPLDRRHRGRAKYAARA